MNKASTADIHPAEWVLSAQEDFALQALTDKDRLVLRRHLEDHRWFLGLEQDREIHWTEAVDSWLRGIWKPLSRKVEDESLYRRFPDRRIWDLYVEICEHWHYLKRQDPESTAPDAAENYARLCGTSSGAQDNDS